jgi:hypothetical protein
MKMRDGDGNVVETVWDAFNVGLGVASFGYNIHEGNYGWAALDAAGLIYDVTATGVPFLPAGASAGFKAYRTGSTVKDAVSIGHDVAITAKVSDTVAKAAKSMKGSAMEVGTKIHSEVGSLLEKAGSLSEKAKNAFKGANSSTGKLPDLSWEGSRMWADLTTKTKGVWGKHVEKYADEFGEGFSLLYEKGAGIVNRMRLRTGGGAGAAGAQAGANAASE